MLCDIYKMNSNYPLYRSQIEEKPAKHIREDVVVCSFGSGGFTRLHRNISYLRSDDGDQTLVTDRPYSTHRYDGDSNVPRQTVYHVFESAPRLLSLQQVLSERFT